MANDTGWGKVRFWDDFVVDTLSTFNWASAATNSGTAFAVNAQVNGVVRGTVTNNSQDDLVTMYGALLWQADDAGPLLLEARVKPITSLVADLYFGFSDAASAELPISIAAGTVTTTASDAAGVYYGGGETTPVWRYGGVAANVDSTQAAASAARNPVLTTYQTLKVVLNEDGAGSFYIDGILQSENVSGCVTATVSLNPYFAIQDDGAAASWDIDYVYIDKGRV